ncbi:MAG TPA: cytochrome c maturation protein CcmE [Rubricoccaceae bacterium]|nr:cytochrome c maturation protein CcmE [Rubricoccaceae bacterium]
MRTKTLFGFGLLAVFGFLVVSSFGEQVAGYEDFTQAAASGRTAHVVGTWLEDRPTTYDPAANRFSFWMADGGGVVRQVVYPNPKPANFEDAEQVVVNGRMEGDVFVAEHILVKCPSKYNDERGLEGMAGTTQPASLE